MKLALFSLASLASAVDLDAMSTTQSFSYLKEQPATLLHQNGYCKVLGKGEPSWRIAKIPGSNVDACNDLCLSTQGCKRFLLGKKGGSRNRCDLISIDDCEIVDKAVNFDYYQPVQSGQVRKHSSHKSNDLNGCGSQTHPQNYLGVRKFGTQTECTNACWQTPNCFAFNMHRGSHCHLYSKDYTCGPNTQQDKYYMDFGDAAPPPPPMPQTAPEVTAPASPDCTVLPFAYQVINMLGRLSYHESEEIIRDKISNVGDQGVRMASPAEISAIIANNTASAGKLTGNYIGSQWVGAEGPYHTQEYVNVGDASSEFEIGSRYVRTTGSFPDWGVTAGLEQGDPVQAGEHAKNTHILYVVPCTEPVPPAFVNPEYNVIAVRGEKQWQTWAQDQNDQLDRQTDAAQTRIPYQSI